MHTDDSWQTCSITRRSLLKIAATAFAGTALIAGSACGGSASSQDDSDEGATGSATGNDGTSASEDATAESGDAEATGSSSDRSVPGWTIAEYDDHVADPAVAIVGCGVNEKWVALRRQHGLTYLFTRSSSTPEKLGGVDDWRDIAKVIPLDAYAIGLSEGVPITTYEELQTVFQNDASIWTNLSDLRVTGSYPRMIYAARQDGSVFRYAIGAGEYTELPDPESSSSNESMYQNVAAFAGPSHNLVLHRDGTCSSTYIYAEDSVSGWTDIVQVVDSETLVAGVRSDGTVVASAGDDLSSQSDADTARIISGWTGISKVALNFAECVGLKQDGTLVYVTDTGNESDALGIGDVIDVAVVDGRIVALQSDGTIQYSSTSNWRS